MATYIRHGGAMHIMRPDQVYRTGVPQPMAGFDPRRDVMANADEFSRAAYYFMQGRDVTPSGMSGPRGMYGTRVATLSAGLLTNWWMRLKLWWRSRRARRGLGDPGGFYPYGPITWAGSEVIPWYGDKVRLLSQMAGKTLPQGMTERNQELVESRYQMLRNKWM